MICKLIAFEFASFLEVHENNPAGRSGEISPPVQPERILIWPYNRLRIWILTT